MIVDIHCHLGVAPQFSFPDASWRTVLRFMDRHGIERAVSCHSALLYREWDLGLRESVEAFEQSGGRLLYYAAFDPTARPDAPGGVEHVGQCLERPGCVGVKIHPSLDGLYGDDGRYESVWRLVSVRRVPLLTHSWDISAQNPVQKFSFPSRFESFVARYPSATLILGHAGGRYGGHVAAADLARRYPNVALDTSGDCYTLGLIEHLVEQAGADKVLFGSDLTWIDPRTQLGMILDAPLHDETKEKILYRNAHRIFPFASLSRKSFS